MAARKPASKTPTPATPQVAKSAAKKATATASKGKAAPPKATATPKATAAPKKAPARKAAAAPVAPEPAPAAKKAKRDPSLGPVHKTRVVIAMDVYEPQKAEFKAPFKANELKWNFLGEGRGLYKRADGGVHCFTQFKDDGVHYSIWGDDTPRVDAILATWRQLLGEDGWEKATASGDQAAEVEKKEQESDALRLWRLAEPQGRPGEPEFFLKKRLAEWQAKKPA